MKERKNETRLSGTDLAGKGREEQGRLKRLERAGAIKLGGEVSAEFWKMPRPKDPEGLLLEAVLQDRGEGR